MSAQVCNCDSSAIPASSHLAKLPKTEVMLQESRSAELVTRQICTLLHHRAGSGRLCLVIDNAEGLLSSAANVLVTICHMHMLSRTCQQSLICSCNAAAWHGRPCFSQSLLV